MIDRISHRMKGDTFEVFIEWGYPSKDETIIGRLTDKQEIEAAKEIVNKLDEVINDLRDDIVELGEIIDDSF